VVREDDLDLFSYARQEETAQAAPLAARMRPRTLGEFVGQEHIVGPGKLLRRAIEADQLFSSIILWGPPGTGKTTLATIVARYTQSHFETLSAVLAGKADLRRLVKAAKDRRDMYGQRTILLVDEIHRWNRAQQDALLPHVENGSIILIGLARAFSNSTPSPRNRLLPCCGSLSKTRSEAMAADPSKPAMKLWSIGLTCREATRAWPSTHWNWPWSPRSQTLTALSG